MYLYLYFCVILHVIQLTTPYAWFFWYADRDHSGQIDHQDIDIIRNPAFLKEWHSFGINEFMPIDELEFEIFIAGTLVCEFNILISLFILSLWEIYR